MTLSDADRRLLRRLGYGTPPALDLPSGEPRAAGEVLDRLLALQVVVAVAGGLDAATAERLLDGYGARGALADDEAEYLADVADGVRVEDAARALHVERVAVLAWALGLGPEPPLDEPVARPVELVIPSESELRPADDLRHFLALHDAMAWALRADPDLAVGAAPGPVDPYVVRERHAALRWLLTSAGPAPG